MGSKEKRIEYIDVAKGIMISLLVFHHYPHLLSVNGVNIENISSITSWHEWFLVFFMPAFFFITGFCSNFNKPFKEFLNSNLKVLLIPAILFIVINRILSALFFCHTKEEVINQLLHGATLWFLWSLFFAKLLHWGVRKLPYGSLLIYLLLTFMGVWCWFQDIPNILYFQNTCALALFLFVGEKCKVYSKKHNFKWVMGCGAFLFVATMIFLKMYHLPRPIVTGVIVMGSYKEIPVYWVLATLGSLFIFLISSLIQKTKVFQSIGKRTLVIYSIHGLFYSFFLNVAASNGFFGVHSLVFDATVCFVICALTVLSGYLTALVIERVPFCKYLIGKW